jgi:iron complex outermembrane receptor protein
MSIRRKHLLASTVIAGLAASVMAPAVAFAQAAAPLATVDEQPKADATEVEALVVTGSRIKRSEFNSPDPIQVISAEQGKLKGISTAAGLLMTSTIASGSPQITSAISSAFVTDGGPGSETISLRGLGANRTLVLLNGRRAGPAGVRGGVSAFDLNVIPVSAIDRIDILKDGASSIYGSDAVAGVVNIITKRDTDGVEIDAFVSQPQKHGGEQSRGSISWGKTFERGYFNMSYDYSKTAEQSNGQRSWTNCGRQYITDANGKRKDTIDPRTGQGQCRDLLYDQIWLYDFSFGGIAGKLQYDYSGKLGGLIPQIPPGQAADYPGVPAGFYTVGYSTDPAAADLGVLDYNSPFNLAASLTPRTERNTVYAQGSFDITDSVEAYGEVLLNRRASKTNGYRQFWSYFYTGDYDPFSAGFTGDFILSPTPVTNRNRAGQRVDYQRYVGGLRGDFGKIDFLKGWDWDLFTQYSHSKGSYSQDVILQDAVDIGAVAAPALDARVRSPRSARRPAWTSAGSRLTSWPASTPPPKKPSCSTTRPARPPTSNWCSKVRPRATCSSCRPVRWAPPSASTIARTRSTTSRADHPGRQRVGFLHRRHHQGRRPCAGNLRRTQRSALKGLPFAENVELSLSGRHTKVNSYGEDDTYKIGSELAAGAVAAPARHQGHLVPRSGAVRALQERRDQLPVATHGRSLHPLGPEPGAGLAAIRGQQL